MAWQGGGRYDFEFSGAAGDLVNGSGPLALDALSAADRFTINIQSFDPALSGPQTYTIATFAGGVTGFDPAPGSPQFTFSGLYLPGSASLALQGNSLLLTFTPVPEPAAPLLLAAAAALAVRWRRRQRQSGVGGAVSLNGESSPADIKSRGSANVKRSPCVAG
jgi:hypothetical protein